MLHSDTHKTPGRRFMEHAPRTRATSPGPRLGATQPNIAYQIVRYIRGLPKKLDILVRTRESWIKSPTQTIPNEIVYGLPTKGCPKHRGGQSSVSSHAPRTLPPSRL